MSSGTDLQYNTKMSCKELVQLMWDLLFGNLTAMDPWRRGAGVSCREAVHQEGRVFCV